MAVPRHNVNLTSAELKWVGRAIAGNAQAPGKSRRFEEDLEAYLGVRHVRAVDSGRVALHLALHGLGLQPGDQVVLPRYCFYSLAHVLEGLQLSPIWAPIDPETLAIDPTRVCLDGASALVLIHPFGQVGPVAELRAKCAAKGVALIEDGSQATGGALDGKRVGALGDVGVFSLVSGKNLQTFGGGFISTDDSEVIERVDALLSAATPLPTQVVRDAMRSGMVRWFLTTPLGFGGLMHPLTLGMQTLAPKRLEAMFHEDRVAYDPKRTLHRLSDTQGHLGCLELSQLDRRNRIRRDHAHRLMDGLQGVEGLILPKYNPAAINTWNALAIRLEHGAAIQHALRARGIDTRSDYMSWYGTGQDFRQDVIYLPNHPGMRVSDLDKAVRAIREVLSARYQGATRSKV